MRSDADRRAAIDGRFVRRGYERRRAADAALAGAQRLRNTQRWKKARRVHLLDEPLCRACSLAGRARMADDVDHVVPLVERPDLAFDDRNLQSLCRPHHNRKTALEAAAHRRGAAAPVREGDRAEARPRQRPPVIG